MSLLKPAKKNIAYFKEGLYGFQGSGKTFCAVKHAIFLWKMLQALGLKPGPVAMFDTENGSAFAEPEFRRHGIPFFVFRGRSFSSLMDVANEALDGGFSIFIVDSATHIWRDLVDSYLAAANNGAGKKHLAMHDWNPIKTEWARFPNMIVNAPIHMIVAGRAGYEYDTVENEGGGYDAIKTGTKFKAEGEFGFEPSIVFELSRARFNSDGKEIGKPTGRKRGTKEERAVIKGISVEKHRLMCVKDRNMDPKTSLDGRMFDFGRDDPEQAVFEILKPHLALLNIGGVNEGVDTSNSAGMFDDPDRSRAQYKRQCEIVEEEIEEALTLGGLIGRSDDVKKQRAELLISCFGTSAWKAITSLGLDNLKAGLASMRQRLGQPDRESAGKAEAAEKPRLTIVAAPDAAAAPPAATKADGPSSTIPQEQLPSSY